MSESLTPLPENPSPTTSVKTEGGTYLVGDTSVGEDFVGRDKHVATTNNFSNSLIFNVPLQAVPTPAGLNDVLRSVAVIQQGLTSFSNLVGPFPELRDSAGSLRTLLEQSRRQIRRVNECKGAHDRLQRLEAVYRLLAPELYDFGRLVDAERVNWKRIRDMNGAVKRAADEVLRHVNEASFAEGAHIWLNLLSRALNLLRQGYENRDLKLLDGGAQDIDEVIGGRITEMNNYLVQAVDGLDFPGLLSSLRAVHDNLAARSDQMSAPIVIEFNSFAMGLSSLSTYAEALQVLCRAHHAWQRAYDLLSAAQAQLGLNPQRFVDKWKRVIKDNLLALFNLETNPATQTRLVEYSEQLSARLAISADTDALSEVEGALYDLREAVTNRFGEIDHDLHRVCEKLREAGGPLETVLETLR